LSIANITFAPLLSERGCRTLGYESATATSSVLNMRWAFMRGLAGRAASPRDLPKLQLRRLVHHL